MHNKHILSIYIYIYTHTHTSSSSIGTTAQCGLWPVEQRPSIFSYLPPTLSIFSLPALEDLFLLPLSIFSWVFPFFSSLPVLEWISFWASYPPPYSLSDLISLSFALVYIRIYILRDRGGRVAEELCYEGRCFDPSWCHWNFSLTWNLSDRTIALGLTQPLTEISTRSISWG